MRNVQIEIYKHSFLFSHKSLWHQQFLNETSAWHRYQISKSETTSSQFLCLPEAVRSPGTELEWLETFIGSLFLHSVVWLINEHRHLRVLRHHFVSYLHHISVGRPPKTLLSIWPTSYNNHFFTLKSQRKLLFQHRRSIYHESYCVRFVWGKVCLLLCGAEDYFRIQRQENVSELPKGNGVTYISMKNMKCNFMGQCLRLITS